MTITRKRLAQLMVHSDPVRVQDRSALGPDDRERVEEIMRTESASADRQPRVPRRRRMVSVGFAAAGAAVLIGVGFAWLDGGTGSAVAATPDRLVVEHAPTNDGARSELLEMAARVENLPNDVGSSGDIHMRREMWSLFTRIDGEQVTSEVVPQTVAETIEPDGHRTITTTYTHDGDDVTDSTTTDGAPVKPLATELDALTAQMAAYNPSSSYGRFNAVVESHLQTPAPPDARAAVLRYLAATTGVKSVGEVTDRLGRTGVGFTVSSDASGLPTQYMLIVDPQTGHLLGYEEMLTDDAGKLNVDVPSVIQYIAWERAEYSN